MMMSPRTVLVALAVLACLACSALASQPMLAWSQDESLASLNVADAATSEQLVASFMQPKAATERVSLIFVQQDVTVEDLTTFSQSTEETPFLQKAHAGASSRAFAQAPTPLSNSDLLALVNEAESSIVLDAADVTAEAVQGSAVVVVRLPSRASCNMLTTDATVESIVSTVDAAVDAPMTVAFLGTTPTTMAARPRARRSAAVPSIAQQRLSLLPEPTYVASRPEQRHEVALQWFSIPILSGVIVGLLFVFTIIVGSCGLLVTQTPEQWPDAAHDKNLDVPQ
ncbi:hypothetical protein PTSG_07635 [Salpingoeca rosetta]|uniref:Uncharacterized protein n=1 Tax=Salpingoeca rosetta (strain ATCC 50818 / BSB-021) TaxID=946362 RepID=F2UHB9_SALR5|nr:uncharacterized protein PTSG_07635 [Salpingoeca rosetta]EGD76518.1 hypothetical protein PTSG_07635 [Salpingoeca rosetta]|eukprot:XP_004991432.1 hypothetical protein PTSG_07635 [Salpingoeca rosetta]